MIEIKNKQILIDGEPKMIMCGEIHYFRLNPSEWQDRINKLKESGCNAVASYVPWIIHEYQEGVFDFDGTQRPEHDLISFIDLCAENDLYFFVRPGPFIMAEIKNEGLPYWVYDKHPEIIPVGWDRKEATTRTVDYLAQGFLQEVRKWYKAVMAVIQPRLYQHGGNIIALQLDNEVGMLSWVSNTPDLTDFVIEDFVVWLENEYEQTTLKTRYPFDLNAEQERNEAIRSPKESYSLELMKDLGYYMRNRFARYIAVLREFAEENGVTDIPFVVNIHGTGGGRGFTYPIGISQLYESYTQGPGYISGSDIYFGDLTVENFQDLYIINGFMDAVHQPDQPLTSVEFNCGDGNFGNNFSGRHDPSAADFKARMCVAQGNRLINYYLFTGGYNYRFEDERNDGNDRIAFTGEQHGFAAPIGPDGDYNYTFPRMARSIQTIMGMSDKLATMNEQHDNIAFGFIPDYYMTEYHYLDSERMTEVVKNIESRRNFAAWESMGRAMLLSGYRFGSVDIQGSSIDPSETPVLALPSAKYMEAAIQQKLVDYLKGGGKLLLFGEVPLYDMEGKSCALLAEALNAVPTGEVTDEGNYFLSVFADGWAAPCPETRTNFAQTFNIGPNTPILKVYGSDAVCGFEAEVGQGKAIVIGANYTCDLDFFTKALSRLGAVPGLTHDYKNHGLFMTSTVNEENERLIHLLNLDGLDKTFHVIENGSSLFDGASISLQAKDGVMLPVNMSFNGGKILYSTMELITIHRHCLTFRVTQEDGGIALQTDRHILPDEAFHVETREGITYIHPVSHIRLNAIIEVKFEEN